MLSSPSQTSRTWNAGVLVLGMIVLIGCDRPDVPETYVARVGESYLTQEALHAVLEVLPARQDSSVARRQFIDQWVTNELLYQEALRHNLRNQEEVRHQLEESERSVLIDALIARLFEEELEAFTAGELRTYYERQKEQLRVREPFVRVRYLSTAVTDSARLARRMLIENDDPSQTDSLWALLVTRFAEDIDGSLALSSNYFPESQLFMGQPRLRQQLAQLGVGETGRVFEWQDMAHVLHIADRVPAGTIPELAWIEDQVQRRLTIDRRKQMYERQVQRLRTEALSRDALVIQ